MRDKLSTGYSCLHQTLKKIFSKAKFIYTYSVSENVYLYNFVCNFEMPICFRLMLLSVLWQIFSHWWFEIIDGRCYCHLLSGRCCPLCSFVADVISHCSNWNCYFNLFVLFDGWCYCHMSSGWCFTTTEALNQMRIKEALYIRVNDPSLNRNVGKYHLPHVWDNVLVNTSELKLK